MLMSRSLSFSEASKEMAIAAAFLLLLVLRSERKYKVQTLRCKTQPCDSLMEIQRYRTVEPRLFRGKKRILVRIFPTEFPFVRVCLEHISHSCTERAHKSVFLPLGLALQSV